MSNCHLRALAAPLLRRGAALLLALAMLLAPALPAQQPADTAAQGPVIRSDVNLVLVDATVRDKSGQVMKLLKKEDFLLYEDGRPQEITHFSRDQMPLAVALVVDLSGSLEPFLKPLRYATLTALRVLKPEDQVALMTFSSDVELLEDLTHDKRKVSDHFENLRAEGSTNINDALFLAAEYLRKEAPQARRVIVVVSDNVATDPGKVNPEEVTNQVLEADAAVYGIKVPGRNPIIARGAVKVMGRDLVNVNKVASETGGEVFDVEKEGSLFLAFQTVIDRLKTRYTLGFYPNGGIADGRFRKLEVRLQPQLGRGGTDYTLLSKRGYYGPRQARATR